MRSAALDATAPFTADELEPANRALAEIGRATPASEYLGSVSWLQAWTRRHHAWWDDFDVLVSPVLNVPPPELGWLSDPDEGSGRLTRVLRFTPQLNVSGQPAASMPLHWTPEGLPVGVQFVGPADGESLLVRLAAQVEESRPWSDRSPAIFA